MKKRRKRKQISTLMTVMLVLTLVFASTPIVEAGAPAATLSPETWGDAINGSTGTWTLNEGDILDLTDVDLPIDAENKLIVINSNSAKIKGTINKKFEKLAIKISGGANVTIENLMIDNDKTLLNTSNSPITAMDNNGGNTLILSGVNWLQGQLFYPGIHVGAGTALIITGTLTDTLTALGRDIGAGIGGATINNVTGEAGGQITINGGTILASSDNGGAGIGGCGGSGATGIGGASGTIIINGGHVTATGGDGGAGIGGGGGKNRGGAAETIEIESATVVATGGFGGSGIGGGGGNSLGGAGGSITMDSGTITAIGGGESSGIGGGGSFVTAGTGATLNIGAAANVKAASTTNITAMQPAIATVGGTIASKIMMINYSSLKGANSNTRVMIKGSDSIVDNLAPNIAYESIALTVTENGTYEVNSSGEYQMHGLDESSYFIINGSGLTTFNDVKKRELDAIRISQEPNKLFYRAGEAFDATAMVVEAVYKNNTETVVTGVVLDGNAMSGGRMNATISYTEGGVTKATTQPITVFPETWADFSDGSWLANEILAGRDGSTAEKAMQIRDAQDLAAFGVAVNGGNTFANKYVKIASDVTEIDLMAHLWMPIGTAETENAVFCGTFDGNKTNIKNMRMNSGIGEVLGLFGFITQDGAVRNIKLTDVSMNLSKTGFIGAVAGICSNGTISNVYVTGNINGNIIVRGQLPFVYVGGVVGFLVSDNDDQGLVEKCASHTNIDIDGEIQGLIMAGGISGSIEPDSTVQNCYNRGNITIKSPFSMAGGITAGNLSIKTVKWCYNAGEVSAFDMDNKPNESGQIIFNNDGAVRGCYYDSGIVADDGSKGVALNGDDDIIEDLYGKSTTEMKKQSTYQTGLTNPANAWDFTDVWIINPSNNDGFPSLRAFDVKQIPSPILPDREDSTPSTPSTPSIQHPQEKVVIIVNGKEQEAGTETKTTKDGKTTTTVEVDQKIIGNKIDEAVSINTTKSDNLIQLPVSDTTSEISKVVLTGDIVKKLEEHSFEVAIKRGLVEYVIPAKEFTISAVAKELGVSDKDLKSIEVEVRISMVDEALAKTYKNSVGALEVEHVFPPVAFEIVAKTIKTDGTTGIVSINKFNSYVERVIELPADANANKITTGIVFNADGTYSHVPTQVFQKSGKWYAKLNSLTNSTYSVIWNPMTLSSVANHWSKATVNDMASRLVIFNTQGFEPNKGITRADFSEYIVRALGLYRVGATYKENFSDVSSKGERTLAILIANEYGIVTGYPDGSFKPDQLITREEAMTIYSRAMKITNLIGTDKERYQKYADYNTIKSWAAKSVQEVLSAGVFNGTSATTLSPKTNLTYAQAVQGIKNLLVASKLINN